MDNENNDVMEAEEIEVLETKKKENKKSNKNNKIQKKLINRIISFVLAGVMAITGGLYTFRNNIKVRSSETSELEELINNDNTAGTKEEPRNIIEETKLELAKIEIYLSLSNTLNNLYEKYKDKITNLSLGEATISENTLVELSDGEYMQLCNDLEIIATSKKEDDAYYQAIGRAVSYSSSINAYLAYNAPKAIYNTLLDNCANDIANSLGIDFQRITIVYNNETNELTATRNDNNTGEFSYDIDTKGIRIIAIKDILSKTYESYTKIEEFLNSNNKSICDKQDNNIITIEENNKLTVHRNNSLNKDIENYIKTLKEILCSTYEIKNAEFKYDFAIKSQEQNLEETTNKEIEELKTSLSKKITLKR